MRELLEIPFMSILVVTIIDFASLVDIATIA